jgi:triphosphoribosyl-dephospho-CoA synthetase
VIACGTTADLARFEAGKLPAATFSHGDHVRMAFAMLAQTSFAEGAARYGSAIRRMAISAGKPEAYHATITLAFLALIGERMASNEVSDYAYFAAANPDLFEKKILSRYYSEARLKTPIARSTFLLPDRAA